MQNIDFTEVFMSKNLPKIEIDIRYFDLKTFAWKETKAVIGYELQYDYSHCTWVSIDGEFTGVYPQRDKDILWTIASQGEDGNLRIEMLYTFDDKADVSKLSELMASNKEKIFWYGVLDLAFLMKRTSLKVAQPVFDAKIASKLIRTYTPEHSVDSLLTNLFDAPSEVTNKKELKLFRELGRPIKQWPKALHQYNANDVMYLKPIADKLKEMSVFMNRKEIIDSMHIALPEIAFLQLNGFYRDVFHPFYNDTDMNSAPILYGKR